MPWISRKLRGTRVFVRTDADGVPQAADDGRVDILYKLESTAKVYRAALRNLEPTGDPNDEVPQDYADAAPGDVIEIYTDGACTGNPGPAGLGAVILDGDERRELSEYLGEATNNIAELTAILRALEAIADPSRPVRLHSDSTYSIGLLSKGWKAKANQELVAKIRDVVARFPRLQFIKVPAHSGVPENERADELARQAIEQRDD